MRLRKFLKEDSELSSYTYPDADKDILQYANQERAFNDIILKKGNDEMIENMKKTLASMKNAMKTKQDAFDKEQIVLN
jgi:hypothetical protein